MDITTPIAVEEKSDLVKRPYLAQRRAMGDSADAERGSRRFNKQMCGHGLSAVLCRRRLRKLVNKFGDSQARIGRGELLHEVDRRAFPAPTSGDLPQISSVCVEALGECFALWNRERAVEGCEVHTSHLSAALRNVNSAALRHRSSAGLSNLCMRTIEEVRRIRLAELVAEFGGYANLNEKLERDRRDSTLSQVANKADNSKGASTKSMGSKSAREIEVKLGKEPGWFDTDPELVAQAAGAIAATGLDDDSISFAREVYFKMAPHERAKLRYLALVARDGAAPNPATFTAPGSDPNKKRGDSQYGDIDEPPMSPGRTGD